MLNPAIKKTLFQLNLASILGLMPILLLSFYAPIQLSESIDQWVEALQLSSENRMLVYTCLLWWLPALLMFVLMRLSNFDHWLKVNGLAHAGLGVANLIMLTAAVCRYTHSYQILYALNQLITTVLGFVGIVMVTSLAWHYVVKPSNLLRGWLLAEAFRQNAK